MGLISLIVFWASAIGIWVMEGPKIPLIFIGLWAAGFFGFPFLELDPVVFMIYQTILAIILLVTAKLKSVTG